MCVRACVCVGVKCFQHYVCQCLHAVTPGQCSTNPPPAWKHWQKPTAGLKPVYLSTGRRMMASLRAYQARTLAEDLHPSQGTCHHAQRTRSRTWHLGMWNVRSMVDTEGPIEIASRRQDKRRGEDRKVDWIVREMEAVQCESGGLTGDKVVW